MKLLKQFPNNYGLKKLDKWIKNEKLKRGYSKNEKIELTKTQGAELFKEFYRLQQPNSTSIFQHQHQDIMYPMYPKLHKNSITSNIMCVFVLVYLNNLK